MDKDLQKHLKNIKEEEELKLEPSLSYAEWEVWLEDESENELKSWN